MDNINSQYQALQEDEIKFQRNPLEPDPRPYRSKMQDASAFEKEVDQKTGEDFSGLDEPQCFMRKKLNLRPLGHRNPP